MPSTEVQRTLVKSPPELWAEVSDPDCLAKHLGAFGEIRITRVQPESSLVWEGERASGTVELQAAGWGTKVTLTVEEVPGVAETAPAPVPEPEPVAVVAEPEPEPQPVPESIVAERRRFWDRFKRRRVAAEVPEPPPDPAPAPPEPDPIPDPIPPEPDPAPPAAESTIDVDSVLTGVLDDLGSAHHRPFSRG